MILLEERAIKCKEDMDVVEEFVMAQLGCENHRCAFFRSKDYVGFRVAALYKVDAGPMCVFYERLCLKLECSEDGSGKIVRIFLNDDMVFEGDKNGWKNYVVGEPHECENTHTNKRRARLRE